MKSTLKNIRSIISFLLSGILLFILISPLTADSVHIVEKGQTLYSISKKYQITVAELRAANNMQENDVLKAGQKLVIPTADISAAAALSANPAPAAEFKSSGNKANSTYIVQKGDTFYGIARKYNIPLSELLAMNGLGNDAVLKAGQKLTVPGGSSSNSGISPANGKTVEFASSQQEENSSSGTLAKSGAEPSSMDLSAADPRKYSKAPAVDSQLVWPVKNPQVTYVKGKVSGVQLGCKKNEAVTAIRSGTIMYCGVYRGFGEVVFVQSKTGLIYAYTGLGSVEIQKGDYVVSGTQLGTAGIDTISKKPQITLMVFQNGMPMDPAKAPRG